MSDQTNGIRASILFDGPCGLNFIDLINELQTVFRKIALEFDETAVAEQSHMVFQREGMILRIGYSAEDVDPDALRRSKRPARPLVSSAIIDAQLEMIDETVEVSVTPGAGQPDPEGTMLAACYHVVRHVLRRYQASLVHWQHSGMIFTAEEFENPGVGDAPIPRRPDRESLRRRSIRPGIVIPLRKPEPARATARTELATVEAAQGDTLTAEAPAPAPAPQNAVTIFEPAAEDVRLRHARQQIFESHLIEVAEETAGVPPGRIGLLEQISVYVMTVTIMVLWFPIGFAMLIYNVLRGEDLVATARTMAVTGLGAGMVTMNATQALAHLI